MIASLFRKSTPINYSLVILLLLVLFSLLQFSSNFADESPISIATKAVLLIVLLISLFIVNFIAKKNGLTKNSSFPILFYVILLSLFPSIFLSTNLLLANFFILLAFRRLISLQTLKSVKQKLFDASLWICIAALFHFWCILFLLLVYISILFNASRDYRNWLIPFVALFTTITIFILSALIFDESWINFIFERTAMKFQLDYFTNNMQNIALSVFVVMTVYFLGSMLLNMSNVPMILQSSFKKMIFGLLIGIVVFLISVNKSNAMLVFTFLPLSILCTSTIEYSKSRMYQEVVLLLIIFFGLLSYFYQL